MESTNKPRVTAKDFFLWLGAMVALYVSAVSLILLVHQYINVWFPNALDYAPGYSGAMRFAIASLIVFFPLYIWLTSLLNKDIRKNPEKKELWVRKWLIYLTLFVAGVTMAIDLVVSINTYLNGDLTARFALKALTILVVIGAGFWYYLSDLRGVWEKRAGLSKSAAGIVALIVFISVAGAFFIIGSPQSQYLIQFDQRKENDLQTIQYQIVSYWQQKQSLPSVLSDLNDPISGYSVPTDPQSGVAYEYKATGSLSFELCATFNRPSESLQRGTNAPLPSAPYGDASDNWQHGTGRTCFDRTIDPTRYPPVKK